MLMILGYFKNWKSQIWSKELIMSKLNEWTLLKLDKRFHLKQIRKSNLLENWLNTPCELSDYERTSLEHLKILLIYNVDNWNEQELSLHFIGPLFTLVNFTDQQFNIFAQRYISATVDDEELSGYPDGLIASGWREPEIPYFCFQEYKKKKDPNGDPAGQCLAAMLVAQELNQNEKTVYGCYVLGRNWFFMLLQGQEYAISNAYCASRDDIFDILRIFKVLKQIIQLY
jgi:hypothetical protein